MATILLRRSARHYASEYKTKFSAGALSMASEFLSRLKTVTPTNRAARDGGTMILYSAFAGTRPASDAANFVDLLAQQLQAP
jgi:hypothetical protein